MENQRNQIIMTTIQNVLNDYIEFKNDRKPFTKYLEGNNEGKNKTDSKIIIAKK